MNSVLKNHRYNDKLNAVGGIQEADGTPATHIASELFFEYNIRSD